MAALRMNQWQIVSVKLIIHLINLLALGWLTLAVVNGHLGAEPVEAIIHFTGKGILHTLFACLLITPVAHRFKAGILYRFRRLVGLYAFFWASLHLLAYGSFDLDWQLALLLSEITSRPYLIIGAISWLILFVLSITSFKKIQSKLGKSWQTLHNCVYIAVILGSVHYYWSTKSEILLPASYLLIALGLLLARRDKIVRLLSR